MEETPRRRVDGAVLTASVYSLIVLVAGAAWVWRTPLSIDDAQYYFPAVRLFSASLPRIPLDYPMPMPPLMLAIQGALYRVTRSLAAVRALSTGFAIATVFVVARFVRGSRRGPLVVLMIGTLPPLLPLSLTLKHYSATAFFIVLAYALFESERDVEAGLSLTAAAMTSQLALPFAIASFYQHRKRPRAWIACGLPIAALIALALRWRGFQPPAMRVVGANLRPSPGLFFPQQLLLAAIVFGIWIVPTVERWWRHAWIAVACTPIAYLILKRSDAIGDGSSPDPLFYRRIVGPVSGMLRSTLRSGAIFPLSIAAAIGVLLFVLSSCEDVSSVRVYAGIYACAMLSVPFLFEGYYVPLVVGSWMLLARRIASSESKLVLAANVGAILAGAGYFLATLLRA